MRKILLLLEQIDSFEQFFAKSVSLPQVEVSTPYKKVHSQMAHKIRAISKRLPFASLHQFWIAEWQKRIDDFDTIVVFDNAVSQKLLEFIKSRITKRTKLKIWLWNVPNERIEYLKENFDVYCFDHNYSKEYGLTFLEQFYILDSVNLDEKTDVLRDFYFVGADKGRIQQLDQLAGMIEESELTYLFDVFSDDKQSNRSGINYLDSKITYPEIIEKIQESKVIVEINKEGQAGLTLRALEAIFYGKKLVTNNHHIKDYDFYNPNNILVLDDVNSVDLIEFLNKPYQSVPKHVIERYSFSNWLNCMTKVNRREE
ncbi:glycosyltransferase [Streptococcus thermophilus]|uniref:glycosyltransferase n=1 Tax=Streptococcus thermophilus TaxID=1308 RepID=UPI0022FEAA81|nr:glycosyltransferase [Streptococcus thermophilus]MDA5541699.1 glycosyltransferase [Streptococcus thermophilus]